MTAAAVLRMLAEQGARQVAVTALHVLVWPGIALAIALPALAWRRYHQRRTRITHMVTLPPGGPGEPVIDDALPLVFKHRPAEYGSVTEALEQWEREWNKQQGDDRG